MVLFGLHVGEASDVVAKRPTVNEPLVSQYTERLRHAGKDRAAFEHVLAELKADPSLKVVDASEIAARYTGGRKAATKAAAFTAMAMHIVELIRSDAKAAQSAKGRPL